MEAELTETQSDADAFLSDLDEMGPEDMDFTDVELDEGEKEEVDKIETPEDAERLEGEYEDYVTEQKIPDADALSGIDINVKQLEDKWDEFLEFLNKQGKSLNFNTASQKVAWEQQPEEPSPASEGAGYWINRDDMEDIFVMARDYPGEVPRVDNATFAEQLRHQEGYDFSDLEWDYEIIKTWTQTPQPIGEVKIWQEIANKVGVNLRYTQAT